MNDQRTNIQWTPQSIWAIIFLGCAAAALFGDIIGYVSGRSSLGNNAHIVEYHVCLDDERYAPVNTIPLGIETIYLCGIIEGKGLLGGVWHLYKDQAMINSHYIEHFPGTFFEKIYLGNEISVGSYRIDIFSKKQVRAETQFTVSSEPFFE